MSGEVEDERHFVLDCKAYTTLRFQMIEGIKQKTHNKEPIYTFKR